VRLTARLRSTLRRENGQALVYVVLLMIVLGLLTVLLVDAVFASEKSSDTAATQSDARAAAEAGIDSYVSTLLLDNQYYLQYLAPGEATRKSTATGDVVASVQPPTSPAAWASSEGTQWSYPNGKDAWVDLGNGYSYDLEVTPPQTGPNTSNYLQIVSTGERNGTSAAFDKQAIQVLIRPASVADFFMMTNSTYNLGSGATAYGKIYAAGDVNLCGPAYADVYAEGTVNYNTSACDSGGTNNGQVVAPGQAYDSTTNPGIRTVVKTPINFASFQVSLDDISRAAQNAGGIYLNNPGGSVVAWQLTFGASGNVSYRTCTKGSGSGMNGSTTIDAVQPNCSGTVTTKQIPSNGAIYSEIPVVISGGTSTCTDPPAPNGSGVGTLTNANCVGGRVTVASNQDIIVGDDIGYVSNGTDVLGLMAKNNVYVAEWAPTNVTWRGAVLAENGQRSQSPDACHNQCHGGTMSFSGSTASYLSPYMDMFATRHYNYDATLLYLQPPWFPTLPQAYTIVLYRNLPNGS
jgi:Tfp pilus assembly protein PilX